MVIHRDDVPWETRERGPLAHERARLGLAAGAVGIGLSRYPDSRKVFLRGLGVLARLEPVGYGDGEDGE